MIRLTLTMIFALAIAAAAVQLLTHATASLTAGLERVNLATTAE